MTPKQEAALRQALEFIEANTYGGDDVVQLMTTIREELAEQPAQTEFKPDWMNYQQGLADGAAAEREKVAAWMIQRSYATGHGDTTEDLLKELDWQIDERIAAERAEVERLKLLCEEMLRELYVYRASEYLKDVTASIRARIKK